MRPPPSRSRARRLEPTRPAATGAAPGRRRSRGPLRWAHSGHGLIVMRRPASEKSPRWADRRTPPAACPLLPMPVLSWYSRSMPSWPPRSPLRSGLLALTLLATSAGADTVTVFAAASLTEAFRTIGKDFQAAHPGMQVEFNFASSSTLARQIGEGARADVFASADEENTKKVVDAGDAAGAPQPFARNRLAIVVPKGNPKHVTGLADLGRAGMTVALAAPE